ncbi:APC family permease [Brevibacterium sp. UCMA 11754]|uniref:APC family permease n=1 Tax=Brevibacterium sp. UCMA 11754 TaxID=2749198 RepID=UPI001F3F7EE9|nr:amino acid permease [Brevibacterium sp. UCMA 11754]MCF2570926.1 amino acid permease [Brevibacterium sp. UCMA 11754]
MDTKSANTGKLTAHIGLGQGVALYVSAILGAGVLVLPGQIASSAGPASLLSWVLACAIGAMLALLFVSLARRLPGAGGIATYVGQAYGATAGGLAGWMYFSAGAIGQIVVPLTGGYYVAEAFSLSSAFAYLTAAGILAVAVGANLVGAKVSTGARLGLALTVALALLTTIIVAIPRMDSDRLTPFAPHGLPPIGSGVIVLFFAFAGWEAVAHLVGEFRDPRRDVPRAVGITIVIVTVLYLGIAVAVVLTGTYGSPEADHISIGLLLRGAFGGHAALAAAVIAVVISLGTANAFIAGVSRLGYSLAKEGWLPRPAGHVSASVPVGGVLAVALVAFVGLGLAWLCSWGTEALVVIPSTLVVFVYLAAAVAGVKLLSGRGRAVAIVSAVLIAVVVPSSKGYVIIPLIVIGVALTMRLVLRRVSRSVSGRTGVSVAQQEQA